MNLPEPSPLWQWHFDAEERWLCLSLDELGAMRTGIQRKNLRDKNFQFEAFSVSDTECYMVLVESLEQSHLATDPRFAFVTCINGVAAGQYHKEVAAKNWFFNESLSVPLVAENALASVQTQIQQCDVLITDTRDDFCNCLLLQSLSLNEDKSLTAFSLIKVSHNRLFPFTGKCLEEFNQ